MAIPPFVRLEGFAYPPDGGLTAYRFLGSTFKHTIPERRTGDKPVFALAVPRQAGAAGKPSFHFGSHAFPAACLLAPEEPDAQARFTQ